MSRGLSITHSSNPSNIVARVSEADGELLLWGRLDPLLRVAVAIELETAASRLVREDDGEVVTIAHQSALTADARWEVHANHLTFFSPVEHDYVARTVELDPSEAEYSISSAARQTNLVLGETARPVDTNCPCGVRYRFGSPACPACGGEDPLGTLFSEHWVKFQGGLESSLADYGARTLTDAAAGLESPLRGFVKRMSSPPPEAQEDEEDPNRHPHALDSYYRTALALPNLDGDATSEFRNALRQSPGRLVASADALSSSVRSWWCDGQPASFPNKAMFDSVNVEIRRTWSPARTALGKFAQAYARALATFAPVHKVLARDRRMGLWGAAKFAIKVVAAVGSGGTSLLLSGGIQYFKETKEQEAFERFVGALDDAKASASIAADALASSVTRQQQALGRHRANIGNHLVHTLSCDYAAVDPESQTAMAASLARHIGAPWDGKALRARGSRPPVSDRSSHDAWLTGFDPNATTSTGVVVLWGLVVVTLAAVITYWAVFH